MAEKNRETFEKYGRKPIILINRAIQILCITLTVKK